MKSLLRPLLLLLAASPTNTLAQAPAPDPVPAVTEDPVHGELRAFREQVVKAVNAQDLDQLLTYLTDDVLVTWQNAEISRGPGEVREYFNRMLHGERPIVQSVSLNPIPDQLTKIIGESGMAHGTSNDRFVLTDGRDFTIHSVWSATVVKQDGAWKIASFHASADIFDNPIMWIAVRQTATWSAIAGVLGGLGMGLLIAWLLRRRSRGAHAATG